MSRGEVLYLLLVVISASAFALVLAYASWVQGTLDRHRAAQAPLAPPPPHG